MKPIYVNRYTRALAESKPAWLWIFTDSLARTSGTGGKVDPASWYYQVYSKGRDLWYPASTTTAVIRGLPNSYPLCLTRSLWTTEGGWEGGLWEDTGFREFRETLGPELDHIQSDLPKYTKVVLPAGGLFGRPGSRIQADRCPLCWAWLEWRLESILSYP